MGHRRSIKLVMLAGLASVGLLPLACGSKPASSANASFSFGTDGGDPNAGQPCAPGQPCPPPSQGCAPGQPCPPPAQACLPGQPCPPPPPPPTASAPQGCQPNQPCTTLDPNVLAGLLGAASAWFGQMGGDPVDVGLKAAAAKYANGMTADGQVAKGNVAENGHVQFILSMDPNKCYTIVAFGAGVVDLDLNLLAPPIYTMSAGSDGMVGPTAVIGGVNKMCPALPIAIPYKVDIYAKKGGGSVGAQVYSKPK